jgi:hypothetical protein
LKISELAVLTGPVSVIGRQAGGLVDTYPTKVGKPLALLHPGAKSADEMFKTELSRNATITWFIRLGGFVAMWIGLALVLNPFKVMADVIGIMGDLVGMGLGLAAMIVAFSLSVLTIAIAWLTFRPLIGGALLALALVGLVALITLSRGRRSGRQTAAPVAPG